MKKQYFLLLYLFLATFNSFIYSQTEAKCIQPFNIKATQITAQTALFNWQQGDQAKNFEVQFGAYPFALAVDGIPVTGTSYKATGLPINTAIAFYVRSVCESGIKSAWSGPFFFRTKRLGSYCDEPKVITSLPYQVTGDDTAMYGDNFDILQGISCNATPSYTNYFAGNDVFYSFTAPESGLISITMTPKGTTSTNSGIFVYSSCADIGVNCLTGKADVFPSPRILDLNVLAGQTYMVMISSSAATQTFTYDLLLQYENCTPKPTSLTATPTSASAELNWTDNDHTSWEVAVQPSGLSVPSGSGIKAYSTPYIATQLTTGEPLISGKSYQYWVRAECTPESGIYTAWLGPYNFNTLVCDPSATCTHIFRMTDAAGNGWNGAQMEVRQNGVTVAAIGSTFVQGAGPTDLMVPLCKDMPFELYWSAGGTQPQQCGVSILNSLGQTIYAKPAATGNPGTLLYTGTTDCSTPRCDIPPINLTATVATNSAVLNWEAPATSVWDIYVVKKGDAAPTKSTTPTYNDVTAMPFEISSLLADYDYNFYVRVDCNGSDDPASSPWSAARTFHTLVSCPKPTALTVSGITTTAAVLDWAPATPNDSKWDILLVPGSTPAPPSQLPPPNPDFPGQILIKDINSHPYTISPLNPATIYYYYVRTVCSTTDSAVWTSPKIFNTVTCDATAKCSYKFTISSPSYSGWDQGRIQIRQNGIVVATLGASLNSAGSIVIPVSLCSGIPFDVYWSAAGNSPGGIGLSIQNSYGDILYTKLPGEGNPLEVLFSSTGNCTPPTCLKPTDLTAANITATSADLSWTESGTATAWEIYAASSDAAPPVNGSAVTGVKPYYIANSNPFTITDLSPSTSYTYYVRAICTGSDAGTWTLLSPKNFITKPLNDECTTARPIPVNPTLDPILKASGNTLGATASPIVTNCTGTADDDLWFSFVATANTHIISFTFGGGTIGHVVYSGIDCDSQTQLYCSNQDTSVATNLVPGETYKVRVYNFYSDSDFNISFDISITTPPAITNDECATATPVPVNPTRTPYLKVYGSMIGATASSPVTTCIGKDDEDIWFTFTATGTTHIITIDNIRAQEHINVSDLCHALYSGLDCAALTQLYCSDSNISVATNLIPGNTYTIKVYTRNFIWNLATFDISITTPLSVSNDECVTAIPAPVNDGIICKVSASGSLAGATASNTGTTCTGTPDDDVWFRFTATANTHYFSLQNVTGTTNDLNFGVYSGTCGNLTQMYCSTNDTTGFVIGQTYYVRVWSNAAIPQAATFDLCIGKALNPINANANIFTPEELVTKVLINNPCLTISNVTAKTGTDFGSDNGIGTFFGSGSDFPLANGIVLSTGNVANVPGPNSGSALGDGYNTWPGDDDLSKIISDATGAPFSSFNASILEFDFTSMNEFMSFNFLFASEEYGSFQCDYADAFAFILTDLTTHTSTNLAVIPGTNVPVSVVTIRDKAFNSSCDSVNPVYFDQYYGGGFVGAINPSGAPINYNGVTQLMTASSTLIAGHPYHIKLVVSDRKDTVYDSAVFIQGGSFSSGPPECMDKINLVAFVDANANGIKDNGEESFSQGSFVMQKNNMGAPTLISAADGNYTLYGDNPINTYDFTLQVDQEYASYYSAAANYNDINIPAGSGTQTLYFPVTVTQDYKDVSITIIPMGEPVPGGSYVNRIVYSNLGTLAASGTINFSKPAMANITNISQADASLTASGFNYNFVNLKPNETHMIDVTMSIPATVNIDDILTGSVAISATTSKSINSNITTDVFTSSQKVVSSYSTTQITEAHTEKIPFNSFSTDEYLTYTIRFQNTGTANATSVRIEDELNPKLDIQSIRMISASHGYVMERVGNKVVWHLDYINLVGEAQNEELSKGYITFKVKLLPGFAAGDIIPNNANIYFDANEAVATNTFNTEFTGQLANPQFESNNIVIYPNPTTDVVQVRLQNSAETMDSIVIYDLLGKIVKSVNGIAANQTTISVGNLTQGIYLVEITTQNKLKTSKKLVIQ